MMNGNQIAAELARLVSPATVLRRDEPLARRTTLRVGGPADFYLEPAAEADLAAVVKFCRGNGVPAFVLGRGSNLVVRDGGVRGVVISLAHEHFSRIEVAGERLNCGAGAKLKNVAMEAKRHDLGGLEFLEGIPGSVGGALRMNAGAMGGATFDVIETVRFMDGSGQIFEKPARELPVEYRACPLFKTHIALGAVFRGVPVPRAQIDAKLDEFNAKRWAAQPAMASAGCTFKNPDSIPAGRLIDELGLKGTRVGGAMVSPEHGNFIVNEGNATARQILELIGIVQRRAKEMRGIELRPEVEIIGED
jgi:UDP-N-acetylenolpyruvoylglucosamine reductase